MVRRPLLLIVLPLLALVVSGCGLTHFESGGWASGTGQVQVIAAAQRGKPVDLTGSTLEGRQFDLASTRGKVTVITVWGSWCGPCNHEAPEMQAAHQRLGAKVPFLGIDINDSSRQTALAFQRGNKITYPSIYAADPTVLLDFSAGLTPDSIPATLILDKTGRVATIIRGPIPSTLTLVEAVQDVETGTHGA